MTDYTQFSNPMCRGQADRGFSFGSIPMRQVFEDYAGRLRERPARREVRAIDMKLIEEGQAND